MATVYVAKSQYKEALVGATTEFDVGRAAARDRGEPRRGRSEGDPQQDRGDAERAAEDDGAAARGEFGPAEQLRGREEEGKEGGEEGGEPDGADEGGAGEDAGGAEQAENSGGAAEGEGGGGEGGEGGPSELDSLGHHRRRGAGGAGVV